MCFTIFLKLPSRAVAAIASAAVAAAPSGSKRFQKHFCVFAFCGCHTLVPVTRGMRYIHSY